MKELDFQLDFPYPDKYSCANTRQWTRDLSKTPQKAFLYVTGIEEEPNMRQRLFTLDCINDLLCHGQIFRTNQVAEVFNPRLTKVALTQLQRNFRAT